ncbi:uncharacterized protein KY384_006379 [Bacidia gigantensis]|uniref:uncharacterized protein n=1 Tax=Bacidia gigantensis TaxID=2732470 RepID=UPI001D0487E4|nr:uncharacterized protein KY384_006379 [Bacidia gigantensis]KAG8528692.1 hypothetical protein KY384_006379 [Bacidia gigantensis]
MATFRRGLSRTGGFSQGGAISLFTGITSATKLGGIFGLSSYLLLHDKIKDYVTSESSNLETPIFMGHGEADPLVQYKWGADTAEVLKQLGWKVDFKSYKGLQHSADPQEIDDLENVEQTPFAREERAVRMGSCT